VHLKRSLVIIRSVSNRNCLCVFGVVCDRPGVWVDPLVDVDAYSGEGLWWIGEVKWCVPRIITYRYKGVPPGLLYS
jgi:hypothetical protein